MKLKKHYYSRGGYSMKKNIFLFLSTLLYPTQLLWCMDVKEQRRPSNVFLVKFTKVDSDIDLNYLKKTKKHEEQSGKHNSSLDITESNNNSSCHSSDIIDSTNGEELSDYEEDDDSTIYYREEIPKNQKPEKQQNLLTHDKQIKKTKGKNKNLLKQIISFLSCKSISCVQKQKKLSQKDLYFKTIKNNPGCGLTVSGDTMRCVGTPIFFDLRNSTRYFQSKNDTGLKATQTLSSIIKNATPIIKKYNLNCVGTGGDGLFLLRIKKPKEKEETVARDATLGSIEIVNKYHQMNKKNILEGPKSCGVGLSYGQIYAFYTDSGMPFLPFISFVSETVTDAYRAEQCNKPLKTSLTLTERVFKLLNKSKFNKKIKISSFFKKHVMKVKTKKPFVVYSAKYKDLKNLYSDKNIVRNKNQEKAKMP